MDLVPVIKKSGTDFFSKYTQKCPVSFVQVLGYSLRKPEGSDAVSGKGIVMVEC